MGRHSIPSNVHRLRGNPSKKSLDELDSDSHIKTPVQVPPCPQHLGPEARTEWRRISPLLVTAGLVTELDRAALAGYCQAWGEWATLERRVKEKVAASGVDALIDVTPSGYKQVAALAQVRDRALDRMLRFAKEFGLTPASRIQTTSGQQMSLPGVPDDPMEGFLQAAGGLARGI